ncbi:MAG: hypothetical protein MUP69_09495 [Candidatus Atribacteria bacterium]|nr:hypothetical protein [Candidatus Atribacteria bacterium]
MKKEIEEIIKEKAKKIIEKYPHFDIFDHLSKKKVDYFTKVKNILYKTLITPERKNILLKTYGFPFNFLFKSDSNLYFSPNFEEALIYLPPRFALYLFEESSSEEINGFCAAEQELKLENIGFYSFYTISELSDLFKNFTTFMKNNNNFLLDTGWPKYTYKKGFKLLLGFAITCPIKIPKVVEDINEWEFNDSLPFIWANEIYIDNYKKIIECDYQHASLLNTLSIKEAGFLEEIRPKIFNLKKIILNEINNNLFSDRTEIDNWYKNCVKIIFDNISKDDLDNFLHINKKYNKIRIYGCKMIDDINGILLILRWLYQEIKFKLTSSLKNTQRLILKGSIFDKQKDIISIYQWMQFAQDPYEGDRVNGIITEFINYQLKLKKRIELNNEFISGVLDSYKKEYLKISLLIKPKFSEQVINFIKLIEISKKLNMDIKLPKELDTPLLKKVSILKLPPDTKWEHIIIQFLNYDKVRIQAPNKFNKVVNFRKMGFENQKNGKPNTQWELFYNLSRYRGDLSWTITTYRKKVDSHPLSTPKIRKQIQRLSNTLKEYFNINDAPFYDYIKFGTYKTKFFLLPEPSNMKNLP